MLLGKLVEAKCSKKQGIVWKSENIFNTYHQTNNSQNFAPFFFIHFLSNQTKFKHICIHIRNG